MYVIEANDEVCHNYQVCDDWLEDKTIEGKNGGFVASSFARELIAENLARNQPWYSGISEKVNSNELFQKLAYEKRGLYQVIQKINSDERDKLFIQACHEAIRLTNKQIYEQANKRGEVPNYERETLRIRTGLSRCKNAETFREFITDFWSRARRKYPIPTLHKHWQDLMELVMDDKQWKKARDLALLALASYKGKGITDFNENKEDEIHEDNILIDVEID